MKKLNKNYKYEFLRQVIVPGTNLRSMTLSYEVKIYKFICIELRCFANN